MSQTYQPKPYKVFRDGKWVTITPEPKTIQEQSFFRGIGKNSRKYRPIGKR